MVHVIIGSDFHVPFHDRKRVQKFLSVLKSEKPDAVVLLGDVVDYYSLSRFLKIDQSVSLKREINTTKLLLSRINACISKETKVYYIAGNHEQRLEKYLLTKAPELYGIESLTVPGMLGLSTFKIKYVDYNDDLKIDGVVYRHGDFVRKKSGMTAHAHLESYGENIVIGHCHRLALVHRIVGTRFQFGMETGCLCQKLDYVHRPDWCRGYGIVSDGKPAIKRI